MYARGTICGLTRGSNKNHIIRACLEAIAYQTNDLLIALKNDTNLHIGSIRADGGASQNKFLMQFQSDISNTEVCCPQSAEATALGAAFLAGLAVGFWRDLREINRIYSFETVYTPDMNMDKRQNLIEGWQKAVKAAKVFSEE
jgi:glycerol kinase